MYYLKNFARLQKLFSNLRCYKANSVCFGYPTPNPLRSSVRAIKLSLKHNLNNIGVHTLKKKGELNLFQKTEIQVISWLAKIYGMKVKTVDGYLTSGGTEGMIMSLWVARNYLKKLNPKGELYLLKTCLSHYSVTKAANILNIVNVMDVALTDFKMNGEKLSRAIEALPRKSSKSIIILATAGYTATGTVDDLSEICKVVAAVNRRKGISCFLCVDAALGGMTLPFNVTGQSMFSSRAIKTLVVDPHKMGLVPYPAGLFLCKKNLLDYIKTSVDYLSYDDMTLIGSRPGFPAVACWAAFLLLGKRGYKQKIKHCLRVKREFIKNIERFPESKVITEKRMNVLAVSFYQDKRLPRKLELKYSICAQSLDSSKRKYYTFYFMPHITEDNVNSFFKDLGKNR